MAVAKISPHPFLQYQKNTFLHMQSVKDPVYAPSLVPKPFLYKKPADICRKSGEELPLFWRETRDFSGEWRKLIKRYVQSFGLDLKLTSDGDTPAVKQFLRQRYPKEMAGEICAFDLHRFRQYGHGLVLEAPDGEVKGTIFEIGYDTPEKTSYTIRLAVDEAIEGKNLGYHLMMYSALLAMEKGSKVKRGLIQFKNLRSLYINLNKVGWVCDGFDPDIQDMGAFFHIALPLDPTGLMGNAIDMKSLVRFIREKQPQKDYWLIDADDLESVSRLYSETVFKIVAVVPKGMVNEKGAFFAMPADSIQLDNNFRPYHQV